MRILLLSFALVGACAAPHAPALHWPPDTAPAVARFASVDEADGPEGSRAADAEHEAKRNAVALLTGWATDRGDGGPVVGLEYVREINEWLGLGGFAEVVVKQTDSASAFGAGAYIRPVEPLLLLYTPAIEFQDGESGEFLMRFGAVYHAWRSGDFIIAPGLYWDVHHNHSNWVLGINFVWEY